MWFRFGYLLRFKGQESDRWSCASVDCINIAPQFSKSVNLHLALSVLLAQWSLCPIHSYIRKYFSHSIKKQRWHTYTLHDIVFNELNLYFSDHFGVAVQDTKPGRKYIQITEVNNLNILNNTETHDEAYRIEISKFSIDISVRTATGAFYAYQTLRSLSNGGNELPVGTIKDQPRFQYRGSMLDVARNFFPKEEVYKLLDAMAMYKLNRFVFYLTEDEGWRLQIPGLPELTDVIGLFLDVFACLLFSLIYSLSFFFIFFVFKSFWKLFLNQWLYLLTYLTCLP